MKLIPCFLLLAASLPFNLSAQTSAFWDVNTARRANPIPYIKLVKPAEVLAADVSIVASSRNSAEQAVSFSNALGLFRAEVSRTPRITIKTERTEQGGGAPSYLSSSGKLETNRTLAELTIQVSLQDGLDSTGAAQTLRALIERVKLPSDVAIKIDALHVEVREPDADRDALLKALAEDCVRLQSLFRTSPIQITGLENGVQQRPINDHEVAVFIPYTFTLGGDKR